MNSCKQLILSDMNRYNIFGSGVVRFLKRYSVLGCRYMIYWRSAHKMGVIKLTPP